MKEDIHEPLQSFLVLCFGGREAVHHVLKIPCELDWRHLRRPRKKLSHGQFCWQFDRHTWKQAPSVEISAPLAWPVGMCVGQCLDACRRVQSMVGRATPRQVVLGCVSKQTEPANEHFSLVVLFESLP